MTPMRDASSETAAASEVLAGARVRGVRTVVPASAPATPRAETGRGVFVRGRRMRSTDAFPSDPTPGAPVPVAPFIVL